MTVSISTTARASEESPLVEPFVFDATYSVYASGFHALKATTHIDMGQKDYKTNIHIETAGLLGKLAPWHGTLKVNGNIPDPAKATLHPENHSFSNTWRKKTKVTQQIYDGKGTLLRTQTQEEERAPQIKTPEPELTQDTIDILSAALQTMRNANATQSCTHKSAVFDGKRRFDLSFSEKKKDVFKASKYSAYEGFVAKCAVEIIPVAGKWRDKPRGWMSIQEQSRDRGALPVIWFGRASENGPYFPVKLQVKTKYGTLILHLKSYRLRDKAAENKQDK